MLPAIRPGIGSLWELKRSTETTSFQLALILSEMKSWPSDSNLARGGEPLH